LGPVDLTLQVILGGLHLPLGFAAVSLESTDLLITLSLQGPRGPTANACSAALCAAEIGRRPSLQAGDLPAESGPAPQGLDVAGDLLARRNGGPKRGVGSPLRLPAE
jgi:hypothetical protein